MPTQLAAYCQQFDQALRPILGSLQQAIAACPTAGPAPTAALRTPLQDLHHHLQALCDKIAGQQAYVLIFGPLKSGKSTLMNAIAGAYVSEVSSLPAYPCLVFVRPGKQREFVVSRWDGRTGRGTDGQKLHELIHGAHTALAEAIRSAEAQGKVFDPQEHFPQAIRRIDVHVPDSRLAASSAVLVDTPGLYTRMRFGYDRMTRDFRDAAACAVFVVKSDTLFLEQVFAEFQQLLALFSRVFLVVNVDAQKRDVGPDGKLVPSLEQSQPEAVLAAFERLAMSVPLRQAAAEGRLRMYPVDLLHAASAVLQNAPEPEVPAGFRRFHQDLTDYLGSSDYLAAFLRDSLQRGRTLLQEAAQRCAGAECRALISQVRDLREHLEFTQAEQQRLQLALQFDWAPCGQRHQRLLDEELERVARDLGQKLLRTLGASIDTWFLSSHSLDWLLRSTWAPLVQDYRDEIVRAGRRCCEQALAQPDSGLDLPSGVPSLLQRLGIDLRALRQRALEALGPPDWPGPAAVPLDIDAIPVRRSVMDRVAFRALDRVRERLFGPKDKPELKIPGKDKAARLGEPGRLWLHQQVTQFRTALAPVTARAVGAAFGEKLFAATVAALLQQLQAAAPRLQATRTQLEQDLQTGLAMLEPLQRLQTKAQELQQTLGALAGKFGTPLPPAEPTAVLQPQPRRAPEGAPTRDRGQRAGS